MEWRGELTWGLGSWAEVDGVPPLVVGVKDTGTRADETVGVGKDLAIAISE